MAIILIVLAIFFFGGEKVSDLARGIGRFTGEFKKGKAEIEKEIAKAEEEIKGSASKTETKSEKKLK